jgi:hypothetical protein
MFTYKGYRGNIRNAGDSSSKQTGLDPKRNILPAFSLGLFVM